VHQNLTHIHVLPKLSHHIYAKVELDLPLSAMIIATIPTLSQEIRQTKNNNLDDLKTVEGIQNTNLKYKVDL